jgi:hypothetical protein
VQQVHAIADLECMPKGLKITDKHHLSDDHAGIAGVEADDTTTEN